MAAHHPNILGIAFKDIEGFPGYCVGDDGSVWCCRTKGGRIGSTWRRRNPVVRGSGHLFVGLFVRGPKRMVGVHTLVLEAFVGPRPPDLQCRHLNGNPADNRLTNLQWGTCLENTLDQYIHGVRPMGSTHGSSKLDETKVIEILALLKQGVPKRKIGRLYGVRDYTIHLISKGETWKHVPRGTPMTIRQFAELVADMRKAQKHYFRTQSVSALQEAMRLERRVDETIKFLLSPHPQRELFPTDTEEDKAS
jgi:hypothetical protein